MIYLSGSAGPDYMAGLDECNEAAMGAWGLGVMVQPRTRCYLAGCGEGRPWAYDNGRFTARGWRLDGWLEGLQLAAQADGCLFATVPDRVNWIGGRPVGDAAGTLADFGSFAGHVETAGLPVAFVAQDGLEDMLDAVPWGRVDVLFVGGSTAWKTSAGARACCLAARRRGVRVHVGRVNSLRRLRMARAMGADSADGTFLGFAPGENLGRLLRWFEGIQEDFEQGALDLDGFRMAGPARRGDVRLDGCVPGWSLEY